jgi:hypothetical protein
MTMKHRKKVLEILASIKDVGIQDNSIQAGLDYLRDSEHSMLEQDIKESYLYCELCCDDVDQFIKYLEKKYD